MISGYTSIKPLIAKVYRDLKLTEEDRWVSMIEWAAEAINLIGAFQQYIQKTEILTVTGKRTSLPCDFYQLQQIEYQGVPLVEGSGTFDTTDDCKDCNNNQTKNRYIYTINNSYVFTNFDGDICMSYLAIPIDDEGFPLIPDSVVYYDAIFRYIVMKIYYVDFLAGRLPLAVYDKLENDWLTKCMAARGKANMPNLDQMENIKNSWVRLIPQMNEHASFFTNMNAQEQLRLGRR